MRAFPLLLIALILYNLIAFGGGMAAGQDVAAMLGNGFAIPLPAGLPWTATYGDLFSAFSLLLLFVEMVRAARTGRSEILNHALSTLVFIGALMEFLLVKGFGTGPFFLLALMALFDVVAGYTVAIVAARRDLAVPDYD